MKTTVAKLRMFLASFDSDATVTFVVDECQPVKINEMYSSQGAPRITLRTFVDDLRAQDHAEGWGDFPEGAA